MSFGAILGAANRIVRDAALDTHAQTDVLRALERTANDLPPFLLAIALEAGVPSAVALARAVGIFFHISALQLADDIADGDCDYITPAEGAGTIAQFMLQNLGYAAWTDAGLSVAVLRQAAVSLAVGASAQSLEVRTKHWRLQETRTTAECFGGVHYAAYFCVMLAGQSAVDNAGVNNANSNAVATDAPAWGRALGIGAAVASDLESNDPRVMTLSVAERVELVSWALTEVAAPGATPLRSLTAALRRIESKLMGALSRLAAS